MLLEAADFRDGSISTKMADPPHVRSHPDSDQTADIAGGRLRAKPGSRRCYSQLDAGPCNDAQVPFHLRLTLPNTKTTGPDWHAQNGGRFVAAALLKAVRISKLIDVKPRVKRLHRNDEVHVLKAARQLAAQIDGTITGLARKRGNEAFGVSFRLTCSQMSRPPLTEILDPSVLDECRSGS